MTQQEPLPGLSALEPQELHQYRSLSGLAVLALLLGLLSFVALAHPAAWVIPLAAVVCGLFALRKIHRHAETLMGAALARTGLLLGLLFLCWAPTSYLTDRWLLSRQGREFAEEWLTAVLAGDLSKPYQSSLPVRLRQPLGTNLDEHYQADEVGRAERDAYFSKDFPQRLAELQGKGRFEFDRNVGVFFDATYIMISPRFFIYREDEPQPVLHLQLDVIRETDDEGIYWTVVSLDDADAIDRRLQTDARQ